MKIKVEFDRELPDGIIEKLMENPDYSMSDLGLDCYDDQLEAMAVAAYMKHKKDCSMLEIMKWVSNDVADGIHRYFSKRMCHNYTEYYRELIKAGEN